MRKVLGVLAILMLLAAACGDDSSVDDALDDATEGAESDDATTDDTADDAADQDTAEEDTAEEDTDDDVPEEDTADDEDDNAFEPGFSGDFDCAEIEAAIGEAGEFQGDPTGLTGEDAEADFERSRQIFETLGEEVPELREDVDAALAGMDKIGEALASIGWDTQGLAADPEAALEFATLVGDTDVLAMAEAFNSISVWFAEECAG